MQCTHHYQNAITFICLAPHQCIYQRKLCAQCLYDHGVEVKQAVPIQRFQEMALQKLLDSKLTQTFELIQQRMNFKYMLSETEMMMKKIWQDLSKSIEYIYDMIDKQNNSYIKLLNQNPVESSYTDLEKLVSIVLEEAKNWWDKEFKGLIDKSNEVMEQIQSLIIKIEFNQDDDDSEVYQQKDDLYEILAQIYDIDESILKGIIDVQRKEKKLDILSANIKKYKSFVNQQQTISDFKQKIKKTINVLRNIQDHPFSKNDYSTEGYKKEREEMRIKILVQQVQILSNVILVDQYSNIYTLVQQILMELYYQIASGRTLKYMS
ncbi:unnamed protein product [Paramecium sonneborni]|uniref:Uncharacterized protein n=1 Tax=Paramecium sonneborni TaxID=65129 RepID=A0A8S1RS40_9CILI|nr:unnamed protein product [Paramecium sonneborni]